MHHLSLLAATVFLSAAASAQDFIHYKFDSPCTTEVINYATGTSALKASGTLQSTTPTPFTGGKFGSALTGTSSSAQNRVITGWDPGTQNVTGSFTMAWFMKLNPSAGSPSYLMGAPSGGFRMLTSGVAGRGLYQRLLLASGGNGVNASITNDFYLPQANADIQTLAATGWTHVAIVVDSVAQTADWFVNGTSVLQLTNVPGVLINAAGPFQLGGYSSTCAYDIDEFLISFRAYAAVEILALSLVPRAGDGPYAMGISQSGNATLSSYGGRPTTGNVLYGFALGSTAIGPYSILIGGDRCSTAGGAVKLPLDMTPFAPFLNGCWLLTDSLLSLGGVGAGATSQVPLPIPASSALSGVNLYSQGVIYSAPTSQLAATLGWATSIGG